MSWFIIWWICNSTIRLSSFTKFRISEWLFEQILLIRRPTFKTFVLSILFCSISVTRNIEKVHWWINLISRFLSFELVQKLQILTIVWIDVFKLHIYLLWLNFILFWCEKLNRLIPNIICKRLLFDWISFLESPWALLQRVYFFLIILSRVLDQMNWRVVRLVLRWFVWFIKTLGFSVSRLIMCFANLFLSYQILFWKRHWRDKWT